MGLEAPKLETLVLKKIILLKIFRFIEKSLMVGLAKIFGTRYCLPGHRFVSKHPDLLEENLRSEDLTG